MYNLSVLNKPLFISIFFIISCSCNKNDGAAKEKPEEIVTARPPSTPPPVHGVCGFNLDENVLINAGWLKTFEDNFDTNFDKWNIWTGGAFNNEITVCNCKI